MEFLSPLGEAGEGPPKRGYRLCEIIASDIGSTAFHPIVLRPCSARTPNSGAGDVPALIREVRRATGGKGLIVDRSPEPEPGLWWNLPGPRLPVRVEPTRRCRTHLPPPPVHGFRLAERCSTPYATTMYKLWDDTDYAVFCHFGYLPVRLPDCPDRPLFLVVVRFDLQHGTYPTPRFLLLTSEPMRPQPARAVAARRGLHVARTDRADELRTQVTVPAVHRTGAEIPPACKPCSRCSSVRATGPYWTHPPRCGPVPTSRSHHIPTGNCSPTSKGTAFIATWRQRGRRRE